MLCREVHTTEQHNFDGLEVEIYLFSATARGVSNVQKMATRLEGLIAEVR